MALTALALEEVALPALVRHYLRNSLSAAGTVRAKASWKEPGQIKIPPYKMIARIRFGDSEEIGPLSAPVLVSLVGVHRVH